MSSENKNVNLEEELGVQIQTKLSVEENCDREDTIVREENVVGSEVDEKKLENDDSENVDLATRDENINSDELSNLRKPPFTMPDTNTKSDDTNCDICSSVDVENITNSLAEKVIIDNVPEVKETECDIKNSDVNEQYEKVLTPEKLVTKVNKINISGIVHQGTSSNNPSAVILKQQTDSLKNLLAYESSSDDEAESEQNWQLRTNDKSESESDSDDSESSDDEIDEDDDDEDIDEDDDDGIESEPKNATSNSKPTKNSPLAEDITLKIYSENSIHDLPPMRAVSDLNIDVKKEEFLHMGHIEAIIETLITVEAIPGTPAFDVDTCLFIEDKTLKKPLGFIYDVIGPVASPLYCIRFECLTDVTDLSLKKGMKVFCAPKSMYTKYVFVSELMKHRGTDASWVGDVEIPPEIAAQMSDDDCDPEPLEPRKPYKRKHGSQERHKQFEDDMNRSNVLHSHAARLVDAHRHMPRTSRYNDHMQRVLFSDIMAQSSRLPPTFDPTVPPPGFQAFPVRSQPVVRPSMVWTRHEPAAPLRPPRCQSFFGHGPSHHANGPGTSSHPH